MVTWRGGMIEFHRAEGCGLRDSTAIARPPWYVVAYRGGVWDLKEWNYDWLDYGGPPQVFLTRKQAEKRAKEFRKQYKNVSDEHRLEVRVVKLNPGIPERN